MLFYLTVPLSNPRKCRPDRLTVAQSRKHTVSNIQLHGEDARSSSSADAATQGCCSNGYLGARNTAQHRFLVGTEELRNTSLTGKCAFRLIGCLILVVRLLSRPAFMSSFVGLLDAWGGVTGRSLSTKGSSSYREIMFITDKKYGAFQRHVHECFQTRDVTRCHLFCCRFPNCTHRAGSESQEAVVEVCHAVTPPNQIHLVSSRHGLWGCWVPSIPNKCSISLGHSAAPRPQGMWLIRCNEWVFQFSSCSNTWCWWVTCKVHYHIGNRVCKNETKHAMTWCDCLHFINYAPLKAEAHSQAAVCACPSRGGRPAPASAAPSSISIPSGGGRVTSLLSPTPGDLCRLPSGFLCKRLLKALWNIKLRLFFYLGI